MSYYHWCILLLWVLTAMTVGYFVYIGYERWFKVEEKCPVCGATQAQHEEMQKAANEIRASLGMKPLPPPDIHTGVQKR